MKKIMFNDKYGLTKAVLNGQKTMTRRFLNGEYEKVTCNEKGEWYGIIPPGYIRRGETVHLLPTYNVGETVAIAQSYETIHDEMMDGDFGNGIYDAFRNAMVAFSAGWKNKMFVLGELMPHHIRITDIKVERLQDISDEDCLKEGIIRRDDFINSKMEDIVVYTFENSFINHVYKTYPTPHEAFAALIDKVSGKGTWRFNPYVFVYSFEKID